MIDSKLGAAAVEMAGRNWLTAQLLARGLEVAVPAVDRGVDLIVFREVGEAGIRALPLQLKCATAERFGLDRKYAGRGIPLAYIWNALGAPVGYFMTYDEALELIGEGARATDSWAVRGLYTYPRIPVDLRARLEPYRDRWAWLEAQLEAQPTSGGRTR
jgi:hypothetical protein